MSVSLSVNGVIPHDETWEKMRNVYAACVAAGVEAPNAVLDYFDYVKFEHIAEQREVNLFDSNAALWRSGYHGVDIDLAKLAKEHPHVKTLRITIE